MAPLTPRLLTSWSSSSISPDQLILKLIPRLESQFLPISAFLFTLFGGLFVLHICVESFKGDIAANTVEFICIFCDAYFTV